MDRPKPPNVSRAFTILEVMTALVVISIISVMLVPVLAEVQNRVEKARCVGNLRALHVATNLYIQEHHCWPQVSYHGAATQDIATSWIAALHPYGLQQINFICPTVQRLLGNPDLTDHDNARLDYISTPFDSNPQTPFKWSKQPWFVENNSVHGRGNLIIFPDGHIDDLYSLRDQLQGGSGSPAPGGH